MPFVSFGLHADLLRAIKDQAFTRPTPIQAEAIPPAMLGRDLLACAATGSGKTAAFMLPTIHQLMKNPRRGTRCLVLTPTRELAAQIHEHLRALATYTPVSGAAIFGGVGMGPQENAFRTGVDILVATPGRLLDHLKRPYAKLTGLEILIIDEADRMLDMGFLPDIRRILRLLPVKRQTLFFSATMPNEIRQLTTELLKNPVCIQIDRQTAPAVGITQAIYPVPQHLKSALLRELLNDAGLESVICFTRTKHRANRLAEYLSKNGIKCAAIHGNRSQSQRTAALAGFKTGQYRVLVATDIAARGIDITAVSHVINFDCPHVPEDYIHRVGRTGRASATGDAFTFIAQDEEGDLRQIERAISKRLPRVTLPNFDYGAKPTERLEVPLAERLAAMRAQKAAGRANRADREQRQKSRPPAGGAFGRHPQAPHTP
ncbi:MAG: DEAD/DEAH box helicase, partial [Phycisphaerae bacterium]